VTGSVEDESGTVLLGVGADGVATLTLNRPHRHNAWNPALERRFYQLLDEADHDDRVRAVVLTDLDARYDEALDRAYRAMAATAEGPDFREGIDSFLQKRPPRFPPLAGDMRPAAITGAELPR
jgi:enoyl-CoA hydratase/carnithine racemase